MQTLGTLLSGNAIFSGNTATSGEAGATDNTGGQSVIIGDSSASNVTFTNKRGFTEWRRGSLKNNSITVNGNVTLLNNRAMGGNGVAPSMKQQRLDRQRRINRRDHRQHSLSQWRRDLLSKQFDNREQMTVAAE